MKYRKTVDLDAATEAAIAAGSLRLQRGQWLRCPGLDRRSRYIGRSLAGVIYAAHDGIAWRRYLSRTVGVQRQ